MTGSRGQLTHEDGERQYELDDELYWSVTTILKGGIPSYALNNWRQRMIAEAALDNRADLSRMLRRKDGRAEAIKWLRGAPDRASESARDRGKAVHHTAEKEVLEAVRREVWASLHDEPAEPVTPDVLPYLRGWRMFRHAFQPRFLATEFEVYNFRYRYAGSGDALLIVDVPDLGEITVLPDYKSGKRIYDDAALQLAAYRNGEVIVTRDTTGNIIGREPMPRVDATWAIHLQPDAFAVYEMDSSEQVFRYFLHAAQVFRWNKEGHKGVKKSLVLPTATFIPEVA